MIELIKQHKAIIFDLDGTLADTMPLHYKASQEICNAYDFDFPLDYFLQEAGRPTVDVFIDLMKILNTGLDGKLLALKKEKRFLELLPSVNVIEEVFAVAKKFHGIIPLAIGSGGQKTAVLETLGALGITHLFDAIVTADDVLKHKPFPDTFLKAATLMGVTPEECIVFEDGPPGIEAAITAKMDVIDIRKYVTAKFLVKPKNSFK